VPEWVRPPGYRAAARHCPFPCLASPGADGRRSLGDRSLRGEHHLHRPTAIEIAAARVLLEPWRLLTSPAFHGVEQIPTDRPFLLVGNHTLMGVLDVPLMLLGLYERCGVMVRPLGDHVHFQVPLWREVLLRFGTVDAPARTARH
jgi:1-acyl-sn-glycerol-3-phosphate acyltransferase